MVWGFVALLLMGGLAWVGFRIEPHWVSKDGGRFLCNGQLMDAHGEPLGRWRETRVVLETNGGVRIDQKRRFRHRVTYWKMTAESDSPPRKRAVFVLRGHDDGGVAAMMALRLPSNSKALPHLRALLQRR